MKTVVMTNHSLHPTPPTPHTPFFADNCQKAIATFTPWLEPQNREYLYLVNEGLESDYGDYHPRLGKTRCFLSNFSRSLC
ncbi:hypothetical protein [Chroococcidiopsis sp.]|uniref:hypothetical protein n=1 Tax=Chroococcidiopsis sp. TaxID=3088168 RepID=UPI003F419933